LIACREKNITYYNKSIVRQFLDDNKKAINRMRKDKMEETQEKAPKTH
jgi:hypothetical protein